MTTPPAQPPTYTPGPPPAGPAPATGAAPAPKNVLAIVALIVAVVGFIFACIPGALIVGWVLLPIAFILSIVALFLKGKKWPAIVGLILAVVGTIVGVIVFFVVLAGVVHDAVKDSTDTHVTTPDSAVSQPATPKAPTAADKAAKTGTRDNPAPLGSTIAGKDFTVVVNSVNLDATPEVLAASQVNQAPAEGKQFALINLTVTYTGSDSGLVGEVTVAYVTSTGNVIDQLSDFTVAPDPQLNAGDELYKGASATGNTVLTIPSGDNGVLRIKPGLFADDVFVALK